MSEHERRVEALSQQLRDERRLRDAAERKAAREAEKARTWRERAEERTERIERLLAGLERRQTFLGRVRANLGELRPTTGASDTGPDPESQPAPATVVDQPRAGRPHAPRLAHVQVAHLVDDLDLARVVAETTDHDLRVARAGLHEADVVVVEESALDRAGDDLRDRFAEWERLDARQPLVWLGQPQPWAGPTAVVGSDVDVPVTFDPGRHRPVGRSGQVRPEELPDPPVDARARVEAAAAAQAFRDDIDPVRDADRRRRVAWAEHHPAAAASRVLRAAGWSFEDAAPEVAAIMVSNRPDDLRRQLRAMPRQLHRPLRLRVGCHGFAVAEVADAVRAVREEGLDVEVLELPQQRPLGWCLNRAIEDVGSPVVAKIDDDDHYGPGYLVDALQALDYSGAAIVGRVCSFTYLEGQDRTVLRRPGEEECHTEGPLVGATMVLRRSAWEVAPFAHKTLAEDVSLQRAIMARGEQIYAASRWDFVYRRHADDGNTWRAPEEHFSTNARDAWDGAHPERADLAWAGSS